MDSGACQAVLIIVVFFGLLLYRNYLFWQMAKFYGDRRRDEQVSASRKCFLTRWKKN